MSRLNRWRPSYPKALREHAKKHGLGMLTLSLVYPDGSRIDIQGPAGNGHVREMHTAIKRLRAKDRSLPTIRDAMRAARRQEEGK